MTESESVPLALPAEAARLEQLAFLRLCRLLSNPVGGRSDHESWVRKAKLGDLYEQPTLAAAAHVAIDLVEQGWTVAVSKQTAVFSPPPTNGDRDLEKQRIRAQEHLRRDEQLRKPSVRRFVGRMERTHRHGDEFISVFNLIRDGRELADALKDPAGSGSAIQPYIQIVDDSICDLTGFRLHDIWRYFRHTWSNAYSTVPGRSMPILVRDAATSHHAVIGLAAISSPVVQIAERDRWMGWDTDQFIESMEQDPSVKLARWIRRRISTQLDELYLDDLLRDGVLQPSDTKHPPTDLADRLRADAERHRERHHGAARINEVRNISRESWVERAETDLFRSKRASALADALEIKLALSPYLEPNPSVKGLRKLLQSKDARVHLRRLVRRARGERVGTVIADLTVCGAVAPYNLLAAGKLVGALSVSPPVLAAYRTKYARPSEIASAMAGRAIVREARLSLITTTSLYGTGSSQYNRLFWPANTLGGPPDEKMGFLELGRSRSFGTSHFTDETVQALVRLSMMRSSAVRVNSLFGEGVSPRLRKVRLGLAALGWPTNELLQHRRQRIVYGVPLAANIKDFSLGIDRSPNYLFDTKIANSDALISEWWLHRWGLPRAARSDIRDQMRQQRLSYPIEHNARVKLPDLPDDSDEA